MNDFILEGCVRFCTFEIFVMFEGISMFKGIFVHWSYACVFENSFACLKIFVFFGVFLNLCVFVCQALMKLVCVCVWSDVLCI